MLLRIDRTDRHRFDVLRTWSQSSVCGGRRRMTSSSEMGRPFRAKILLPIIQIGLFLRVA